MPNDTGIFTRPARADKARADIARLALSGLTATPKTLSPTLFYDDEGCRLFYEITRLPEYYLTRTETALLHRIAGSLLPPGSHGSLVEFGGSDETKAAILLDQPESPFATYVSIDVAASSLSAMADRLGRRYPALNFVPVVGDFMQRLPLPKLADPRMGFFPGSTIGNLEPRDAVRFLRSARESLGDGAWFLLGADLRKAPSILLPAYNDSAGITAAFNLNLLGRLNREAGANFDLSLFNHAAIWNDTESRIEMHLIARRDQTVTVAGRPIDFREGETIHTENSYKRTPAAIRQTIAEAGWREQQSWHDPAGLFGVFLLRA